MAKFARTQGISVGQGHTKAKTTKRNAVDQFQDSRTAESAHIQEKNCMAHDEKMARLAIKKIKYEMTGREAADTRKSAIEVLQLQIQLENLKSQNLARGAIPTLPTDMTASSSEVNDWPRSSNHLHSRAGSSAHSHSNSWNNRSSTAPGDYSESAPGFPNSPINHTGATDMQEMLTNSLSGFDSSVSFAYALNNGVMPNVSHT